MSTRWDAILSVLTSPFVVTLIVIVLICLIALIVSGDGK